MIGSSQTSINFVDPDATWNVARTFPNANPQNPNFVETTTKVFGFIGDTLIGSETWLKFFSTPDSNFMTDFTYLGNLKEENGYVYFMDTLNSVDTIYNFNLQIGDSVLYEFGWGSNYLQIENIDSIEINAEFHKRFFIEEPNYPPMFMSEIWIEGIGSIHGPLFPKYPGVFSDEIPDSLNLSCYKIDNSIIWNNPYYENCYVNIILSSKEVELGQLKIFPNPAKNKIYIENPEGFKTESISIIDISGQKIKEFEMNENYIDISEISPGIYLFKLVHENGEVIKKIIIE